MFKNSKIPTTFIQNEFDPVYGFDELAEVLTNNSPDDYHLIKNTGNNTHDYQDFDSLIEQVKIYFGDEDKQVHLKKIYKALDTVAEKLNSLNITWLLGASSALMVHGVKIVPWDLDILTPSKNIDFLKNEFKDYFVSEDDDGLLLKIGDIEVEIIKLEDLGNPTPKLFHDNLIPVNTLENELYYYEQRRGKENTVRLIIEMFHSLRGRVLHQEFLAGNLNQFDYPQKEPLDHDTAKEYLLHVLKAGSAEDRIKIMAAIKTKFTLHNKQLSIKVS